MKIGTRVRLASHMWDDPDPVPHGMTGTVDYVGPWLSDGTMQIGVQWDNGRSLIAVLPHDRLDVIA